MLIDYDGIKRNPMPGQLSALPFCCSVGVRVLRSREFSRETGNIHFHMKLSDIFLPRKSRISLWAVFTQKYNVSTFDLCINTSV